MNCDVKVSISGGLPFNEAGVTGVSISYGFNMIPCATLTLNVPYIMQNNPAFFENPTQYKKSTKKSQDIVIDIKTATGCITFKGYFDGLSVVQTPGGMEYTAIIKNKFQILTELYPKLMGMYPGSIAVGKFSANMAYNSSAAEYTALLAGGATIDANLAPNEFYQQFIIKVIESQQQSEEYFNLHQDISVLRNILEKTSYKDNLTLCKKLIEQDLDLTFAKSPSYQCSRDLPYQADLLVSAGDDAWNLLLAVMGESGCVLLASSEKLYVIPQSSFLKLDGTCPPVGSQSSKPNEAYPGDYGNFVLNDNSYKNIKYCMVTTLTDAALMVNRGSKVNLQGLGQYPKDEDTDINPDDGASGILFVETPPWLARTIAGSVMIHTKKAAGNQSAPYPSVGDKKDLDSVDEAKAAVDAKTDEFDQDFGKDNEEIKTILDNYAKSRFLAEKYTERTGSFTLEFNPNWVPATTGFLASRSPKIMFNFYVTGVTHNISLNGAKSGTAITQISFNSARYGGNMGSIPFVEQNDLYEYDSGKMKSVQQKWLSDNKATHSPKK